MTDEFGPTNAIGVLMTDHSVVERAFGELEQLERTSEAIGPLAEHIVTELVRHSVVEEQYLYPTVREVLSDGDEIADQHLQEHAEAERLMKDLERAEPRSVEFYQAATTLMSSVRHHVREEENELFPRLQEACDEERLGLLGARVLRAKEVAPTRPHPALPGSARVSHVLASGIGLVDRARDALTGRGDPNQRP